MATPEHPSARGVTLDPQRHVCSLCGKHAPRFFDTWTPPLERDYFHATSRRRWFCTTCAPAKLADGTCHATIDTAEPCRGHVNPGEVVCRAHRRRIISAMRERCRYYGIDLTGLGPVC